MENTSFAYEDLQRVIDSLPQLVWSCLPDGECEHLSRQWTEYGAAPGDKHISLDAWLDLVHPDDRTTVRNVWNSSLAEGSAYDVEYRLRRADGEYRWFKTRGVPLRDEQGQITKWIGTCTDIEDRVRTEEALRESEKALRTVFDSVYDAIILHSVDGKILDVNASALRMYGASREEMLNMSIGDISGKANPIEDAHSIWVSVLQGEDRFFRWKALRPNERTEFDVEVFLRKLRIKGTDVIMGNVRDISETMRNEEMLEQRVKDKTFELHQAYNKLIKETRERKQAEEQLRHSQKMEALGTMAGGIAHDFNNILAAIVGFTELVMAGMPNDSPEHQQLDQVIKASLRARDLIKQMLVFGRATEQKRRPVLLYEAVEDSMPLLRASLPPTIDVAFTISNRSGVILGNSIHIQQILLNLVSNAADAMRPDGGVLKIEVSDCTIGHPHKSGLQPGKYMTLSVSDTGRGIPDENIDRVFDPFFTTKEPGKGTGLGLSVVHGIVKSYDGVITVRSRPNMGTTFTVYLPKAGEEQLRRQEVEASIPRGNETILVVDDESIIAEVAAKMMSELGYKVTAKISSSEALDVFTADPRKFDLVITDEVMPGMTGTELAEKMLALRQDIPIIISSGYHPPSETEAAKTAGIKAFVMKPATQSELARTVREVLDRKKSI